MAVTKRDKKRKMQRTLRVRSHIKQTSSSPRVSVFRSLNHVYAQIIDDVAHTTLASCSSLELEKVSGDKKAIAHQVGLTLAKKAKDKGVDVVVFDRGSFLYHGRVKALAEGLREGGLKF